MKSKPQESYRVILCYLDECSYLELDKGEFAKFIDSK